MKKIAIIAAALCLFAGQAQAYSSIRYRPVPQYHYHHHSHHDHTDQTARNVAMVAVFLGVVGIMIALSNNNSNTTGDAGYDKYLAEKWHGRN